MWKKYNKNGKSLLPVFRKTAKNAQEISKNVVVIKGEEVLDYILENIYEEASNGKHSFEYRSHSCGLKLKGYSYYYEDIQLTKYAKQKLARLGYKCGDIYLDSDDWSPIGNTHTMTIEW